MKARKEHQLPGSGQLEGTALRKPARPDAQRYLKLSTLSEISGRIEEAFGNLHPTSEEIAVDQARSRVSAEDVRSELDIPSRDIAAMDGYAIVASDLDAATSSTPVVLDVKGVLYPDASGRLPKLHSGEAVQVATGAPIPEGADAVVKMEETRLAGAKIRVARKVEKSKNISYRGEDVRTGQVVLRRGRIVGPADVALLIGIGRRRVKVFRTPRVGVLSIGNELTEFEPDGPDSGALGRKINNYSNLIISFLREHGSPATGIGIARDDTRDIANFVRRGLEHLDMIITIAGSSVGARDFAPDAILAAGDSRMIFHGVKAVPIKPAGLAMVDGKPIVISPGHAVSAALTFFVITLPTLNLLSGLPLDSRRVFIKTRASKAFSNNRPLDALLLVRVEKAGEGDYEAVPLVWGSNLMSSLSNANGFVFLKPGQQVKPRETLSVQLMGSLEML